MKPLSDWQPSVFSPVVHSLLLAAAAAGVFIATGSEDGGLGIFLTVAGALLLLCPPRLQVGGKSWAAVGALLFFASLSLLPQSWLPAPEWRRDLTTAGVPLPLTISPTPFETLFWLAILAIAACLAVFTRAHPLRSRSLLALGVSAVAICGAYAALSIYARQTHWEFFFSANPDEFGFFRNRNHTSTFLVTGSVIALGILGVAFRQRHWFAGSVAALVLAVCVTSLIYFTKSRGGVVALVVATVLWVAGLGRAHLSKPLLISFGAVFFSGILLLFAAPGIVGDRLMRFSGSVKKEVASAAAGAVENTPPIDGRVPIFKDTLRLIRDYPITGAGLGNFRYVFPMYRENSAWEAPVNHPESDWLMLAAEAGVLTLLALAGGGAIWIAGLRHLRAHPYWPLRWSIACAVFSAVLHGFVDFPAHRIALGWWILVLAGLAFQAAPAIPSHPRLWQRAIFTAAGLGALALGFFLIRAQWVGGRASPPFAASEAEIEVISLRHDGKPQESIERARRALAQFPLADFLHFQLGLTHLRQGHAVEADEAFRIQRKINPAPPSVPVEQGNAWLSTDSARAGSLWLEAVDRQERIDALGAARWSSSFSLLRDLLNRAQKWPEIQTQLLATARFGSEFALIWLEQAAPELVRAELPRLGASDAFSQKLSAADRRRFARLWYTRGDRDALAAWLARRAGWEEIARPIALRRLADEGKFADAVHQAVAEYHLDLALPEPGSGERDAVTAPAAPSAEFDHLWRIGNVISARRILDEARADPGATDPEAWQRSAALAAREERWEAAWQALSRYLDLTRGTDFP